MKPIDPDLYATRATLLSRVRHLSDQSSWQEFHDRYWRLFHSIALNAGLTESEAQDVVQEVLIAVSKAMPTFRYDPQACHFRTWLCRLTGCKVADQFRKRHRRRRELDVQQAQEEAGRPIEEIPDDAAAQVESLWDAEFDRNLLQTAMNAVKAEVRPERFQIYDLYVSREMPVAEVARLLHVTRARVYLTKHRIEKRVQAELARLRKEIGE